MTATETKNTDVDEGTDALREFGRKELLITLKERRIRTDRALDAMTDSISDGELRDRDLDEAIVEVEELIAFLDQLEELKK